jgi:uncharacterized protein
MVLDLFSAAALPSAHQHPGEDASRRPRAAVPHGHPFGRVADRSLRHAGLATDREKNLGMLCHLIALSGFIIPFGNILGPLIVWMIGKSDSDFVNEHGKSSLNFQISLTLFFILSVFLILFIGPIAVVLLAGSLLYGVVMVIVNGVKAHNGDEGPYTLTIIFLS